MDSLPMVFPLPPIDLGRHLDLCLLLLIELIKGITCEYCDDILTLVTRDPVNIALHCRHDVLARL